MDKMKTLKEIIQEKLKVDSKSKVNQKIICHNENDLKREIIKKILDKEINYNDLDVSNIKDFSYLFSNYDITEIDISEWDVSKATTMRGMFKGCKYLQKTGNLKNWKVVNVKDFSWMFSDCINLIDVGDLSLWDIDKDQNVHGMFNDTKKLQTIGNVKNWRLNIANWDVFNLSKIPISQQPPQKV